MMKNAESKSRTKRERRRKRFIYGTKRKRMVPVPSGSPAGSRIRARNLYHHGWMICGVLMYRPCIHKDVVVHAQ